MKKHGMTPVFLYTPTTSDERMRYINKFADGFIYCVARKGVTGAQTDFSKDLDSYLARCRAATDLPLALGFGVKDKADVDFLRGKVDIAVIGTATINIIDQHGVEAVGPFLKEILS